MNKKVTIVTAGQFEADVLRKILGDKTFDTEYQILLASGYSSALSKARSLLTLNNQKVILLLDTDTVETSGINEKKDFVNYYVNATVNKGDFKTVWAIPEFEIIFLNNKKFLRELHTDKLSKELIEVGKSSPKKVLESITNRSLDSFLPLLNNKDVRDAFFEEGPVKEISDFMEA